MAIDHLVGAAKVRAHYAQIPMVAVAPTAGCLFSAWVLWGSVDNLYLVIGFLLVSTLSAGRLLLYRHYFALTQANSEKPLWRYIAVAFSLISGCIWGSAAPLLYPPHVPDYDVFLLVLLTLVPIIPVAALAAYLPAFYAYYIPCFVPFVVTLAIQDSRSEKMTAALLVMMMFAMLSFARRYAASLDESIRLRMELSEKSEKLERIIKYKSQFIAAASHDLRQPLYAMGLFLGAIWGRGGGSAEDTRLLSYLRSSLRNLGSMLHNILDISTLEAEVVKPRLQDVSISKLLKKLEEEYAPVALQRELEFRCRGRNVYVFSDPVMLERMIINLLWNAFKYTRHGGVALVCRRRGHSVLLQVIDTGSGIPAARLSHIFQEYTQIEGVARGSADGLGLGLAIVSQMAALLGHAVSVKSNPGRGSTFSILMPLGEGRVRPVPPMPPQPARVAGARASFILIIDDNDEVAAGACALLDVWGHRSAAFSSAEGALSFLAESAETPSLLMVDFGLGTGHSGLQAVDQIQQHLGRKLPVILVTGDTAAEHIREAYAAGHTLLHKPVDPECLQACIADIIRAAQDQVAS